MLSTCNYISIEHACTFLVTLKYYATFRVRKFELFCKINKCLQKTTTCFGLREEQILQQIYDIHIFSFGHSCYGSFPMLFSKAPALYCKKHLSQFFLHCTSIVINSKTVSQVFNILFQTKDINIFVLRCVFFSRYVQLKTSFSDEKNISIEI